MSQLDQSKYAAVNSCDGYLDVLQSDLLPAIGNENDAYLRKALVQQLHTRLNSLKRFCHRKSALFTQLSEDLHFLLGNDVLTYDYSNYEYCDNNDDGSSDKDDDQARTSTAAPNGSRAGLGAVIERDEDMVEKLHDAVQLVKCTKENSDRLCSRCFTKLSIDSNGGDSSAKNNAATKENGFSTLIQDGRFFFTSNNNSLKEIESPPSSDDDVISLTRNDYNVLIDIMKPFSPINVHQQCFVPKELTQLNDQATISNSSNLELQILKGYIIQLTKQINRCKEKLRKQSESELLKDTKVLKDITIENYDDSPRADEHHRVSVSLKRGSSDVRHDRRRPKSSIPSSVAMKSHQELETIINIDLPKRRPSDQKITSNTHDNPLSSSQPLSTSRRLSTPNLSNMNTAEFNKWMHSVISKKPPSAPNGLRASMRSHERKSKDVLSVNVNPTKDSTANNVNSIKDTSMNNSTSTKDVLVTNSNPVKRSQSTGFLKLILQQEDNEEKNS